MALVLQKTTLFLQAAHHCRDASASQSGGRERGVNSCCR